MTVKTGKEYVLKALAQAKGSLPFLTKHGRHVMEPGIPITKFTIRRPRLPWVLEKDNGRRMFNYPLFVQQLVFYQFACCFNLLGAHGHHPPWSLVLDNSHATDMNACILEALGYPSQSSRFIF